MKTLLLFVILTGCISHTQAQVLKKMKDKASQVMNKAEDKVLGGNKEATNGQAAEGNAGTDNTTKSNSPADLKVYSKFDFVPGSTILYYDNFE